MATAMNVVIGTVRMRPIDPTSERTISVEKISRFMITIADSFAYE